MVDHNATETASVEVVVEMDLDYCFNYSSGRPPNFLEKASIIFWIEGVALCLCGIIGMIGTIFVT